jgi:hypothetical protein
MPVLRSAGVSALDALADYVLYPTAQRLLQHCDAVLRLPGQSAGADQDVATARKLSLPSITMSPRSPPWEAGTRRDDAAAVPRVTLP